ncbi:Abi-domain-containing protein [Venturia nashicola]|uniref:intramembrane prenyl-peptidase Rce1 n=1 Tax=Venturia nashicola TaxID=86259 RepID=A0A4Z1PE27_9PEZI|nr:Abi-domain-containing protein [Venturia nashicola]
MAPIGLLDRVKNLYRDRTVDKAPAIAQSTCFLLSVSFIVLYVLPFYLSKTTRPSPTLSRDAPSVIRARIRAVTSACIVNAAIVVFIILQYGKANAHETLRLLGWWPFDPLDIVRTLLLCAILFVAPLFEDGFVEGSWRDWVRGTYVLETLSSWTGWRNLVAGPVTEEIVFRSLLIPLHLLAKTTPKNIVFLTPLYFGIAHIHHLYEFRLTHPEVPVLPAFLRTAFQFTYTSLFGFFAAFVFLRTGSVYAAIAAHSFCNWQGLPRLYGRVGAQSAPSKPGPGAKRSDERTGGGSAAVRGRDLSLVWTIIYYSLLLIGAYSFYVQRFPLTESSHALLDFKTKAK